MEYVDECLAENEEVVYTVGDVFFLTNRRVISIGNDDFKDVAFKHISSIEWKAYRYPWLLIVGAVSFVLGLVLKKDYQLLIVVGTVFIVLYFFLKKYEIMFITAAENVSYDIGRNAETVVNDISKVIRKE